MQREAKSSIILRHWIRANPYHTCSLEVKDTRGKDYLNFSEVKQAQIDYGLAIESDRGVLLRTQAVAEGMPDYIYLRKVPAYVAIKFPKMICIIDINVFFNEKQKSQRKSLTSSRAKEISFKIIELN